MKYFTGCTALITGVTAGLGHEFAIQLAPLARALVLVARRTDRLESLERELRAINPELIVHYRPVDLADETQIDGLVEWLDAAGVNVNVLINNAGLGDHGDFAGADWQKLKSIISVNVTALTKLTYALLPALKKSPCGLIMNVSSIASFVPVPNSAVYAASKAYVTSLTEALRAELRETGIAVTTVCPGPVETEFGDVAKREGAGHLPPPTVLRIPAAQVVYESLAAAAHDRARVIPGLLNVIFMAVICALPMFVLRLLLNKAARMEH